MSPLDGLPIIFRKNELKYLNCVFRGASISIPFLTMLTELQRP